MAPRKRSHVAVLRGRSVREALGSALVNIYAEGYPNPETHWLDQEEILDYEYHLAYYRRYDDRRYYRRVECADVILVGV